jgi:hypothetical protein
MRLQSGRWLETGANIQYNQHLNNDLALDYLTRTLLASVKELVRVMTNNKRYGKLSEESEPQRRAERRRVAQLLSLVDSPSYLNSPLQATRLEHGGCKLGPAIGLRKLCVLNWVRHCGVAPETGLAMPERSPLRVSRDRVITAGNRSLEYI